ncbi:MAG: hypothetical protein VYB54_10770 [Pseudomonadota bacterium]|nr:hypothetical protein [Pseudomonadota bacterium]
MALRTLIGALTGLALAALASQPAQANMSLNKVIVDIGASDQNRDDIEVTNAGKETLFIKVDPYEILNPGTEKEERVSYPSPRDLGILVSPNRMVLEPGQRKLLRIAVLDRPKATDRIYRVHIYPVTGEVTAERSGVKIVIAYDALVIVRPETPDVNIVAERQGRTISFRNAGNTAAMLMRGEQCAPEGQPCEELPSQRLYAGNSWTTELPKDGAASWVVEVDETYTKREF